MAGDRERDGVVVAVVPLRRRTHDADHAARRTGPASAGRRRRRSCRSRRRIAARGAGDRVVRRTAGRESSRRRDRSVALRWPRPPAASRRRGSSAAATSAGTAACPRSDTDAVGLGARPQDRERAWGGSPRARRGGTRATARRSALAVDHVDRRRDHALDLGAERRDVGGGPAPSSRVTSVVPTIAAISDRRRRRSSEGARPGRGAARRGGELVGGSSTASWIGTGGGAGAGFEVVVHRPPRCARDERVGRATRRASCSADFTEPGAISSASGDVGDGEVLDVVQRDRPRVGAVGSAATACQNSASTGASSVNVCARADHRANARRSRPACGPGVAARFTTVRRA